MDVLVVKVELCWSEMLILKRQILILILVSKLADSVF